MSCYSFINKLVHRSKKMAPHEVEIISNYKTLLEEKTKEICKKDDIICQLEKKLEEKEYLIRFLQNEIDKFRQVVRPITQKIITKQISLGEDLWPTNGHFDNKVNDRREADDTQNQEPSRIKREGISAEPVNLSKSDLQIKKIHKSPR